MSKLYIPSFDKYNDYDMNVIALFVFCMGHFWARERFSDLPKVTQSVSERSGVGTPGPWAPKLMVP